MSSLFHCHVLPSMSAFYAVILSSLSVHSCPSQTHVAHKSWVCGLAGVGGLLGSVPLQLPYTVQSHLNLTHPEWVRREGSDSRESNSHGDVVMEMKPCFQTVLPGGLFFHISPG
jgi:hypothetical protein